MQKFRQKFTLAALALALTLSLGLLARPALAVDAWLQPSVDKLMSWGVLSGYADGDLHINDPISRAEFTAMVNRAYGYDETSPTPFTDVSTAAWYAEDIAIGYATGYFKGSSETMAEPENSLTREQAITVLARNLRLEEAAGEVTNFRDGHDFASWSRGYIKTAVNRGLVNGYEDGSFRPASDITRGEMSKLLSDAIGTLVDTEGTNDLGSVWGNVTITTPHTTLRNTTVGGDLYLTSGVGLGDVTLENVRVLGRIIVAGGGESEGADASITMRNVDAPEMIIDTLSGQYISVSVQNDSEIEKTTVRTNAYLEDNTRNRDGLANVYLDGQEGARFTIAGNMKNVVNKTPRSALTVGRGTVEKLTIDEMATASTLTIDRDATVDELNLDCGIAVSGNGDIGTLNVSAPGASTTMLPDNIVIRPGITANIAGQVMDSVLAEESSSDPRLLSGYPELDDIAPTSINAIFSGNKQGTVYWAITPEANGYIDDAETLIKPPTWGPSITKTGNTRLTASETEANSRITGLASNGSYYLSAVLVDSRKQESPVKRVFFTTPDNTVPNFASGYPYMSLITNIDAQVTAMTTKDCYLYWAVLPQGAAAPTANDFLSNAISGNLGYGSIHMTKNEPDTFYVNDEELEELETYDLYLWLTDADAGLNSTVRRLSFTTVDKTPPEWVNDLRVNREQPTSIGFIGALNENCTVYWVAVTQGTEYPKPQITGDPDDPDNDGEVTEVDLSSEYAKMQITYGLNALKSGRVSARANTDFNMNVSGLTVQTTYDIYYVAVDSAGNYEQTAHKITANTQDTIAPTVTQEFTRFANDDASRPYANTDVKLIFSENVMYADTNISFMALYEAVKNATTPEERDAARDDMAGVLRETVWLYSASTGDRLPTRVNERTADNNNDEDWVIDYRNVQMELEEGQLILTFATTNDENKDSALHLAAGNTYYFEMHDITDASTNRNRMGVTALPRFTTIAAQAWLEQLNITKLDNIIDANTNGNKDADIAFSITPLSTSTVEDSVDWDLLLWLDTSADFELYKRERASKNDTPSEWQQVGGDDFIFSITTDGKFEGRSVNRSISLSDDFPQLNEDLQEGHIYEYAVHFTRIGNQTERNSWSQRMNLWVSVMAGSSVSLGNLAANVSASYESMVEAEEVSDIGTPALFRPYKQFDDQSAPKFTNGRPTFEPGDTSAYMNLMLDRTGTVYYVVAPAGVINTRDESGSEVQLANVPTEGGAGELIVEEPNYRDIVTPTNYSGNKRIKTGNVSVGSSENPILVTDLEADTDYYVYFVIKGAGQVYSEVQLYTFRTKEIVRPVITLDLNNPIVNIQADRQADVDYLLINYDANMVNRLQRPFNELFSSSEAQELNIPSDYLKDNFSVLQAMYTDVTSNNRSIGSVFDVYAPQTYKDDMANYIRATNPDGSSIIGKGNASLNLRIESVDCSKKWTLSGGAEYAFLAVGRSPLGSGDAFRAIYPVTLVDKTPPMVQTIVHTLQFDPGSNNRTVSGEITIQFTEPIYRLNRETTPPTLQKIDAGPLLGANNRKPDFVSIQSLVSSRNPSTTGRIDFVSYPNQINIPAQVLQIKLDHAPTGASITCFNQICDAASNVNQTSLNVTMKIVTTAVGQGTSYDIRVTVPAQWNATGNPNASN